MNALATSTPLQNGGANHDAAGSGDAPSGIKAKPKGLIEKIYQKKSQLEHILLRPDTYIGSVEPVTELMWVYCQETGSMIQREITYVPGLYKIFDEILVNAADNKQRDEKMDCIKININPDENVISVWNNGKGIPVVEHKDEKMYVPTMIFGHLLTSSNYNDDEQKVTGGRNGYGAKLCNIFSTKFTVETASKEYKRKFKQTWTSNMTKTTAPAIKDSSEDYTKITFSPDLAKFKMESLDKDTVDLLSRRAYDVAASTRGVKVYLNDQRLPIKNFKDYIDLYIKDKKDDNGEPMKVIYEAVNPRWEIAVTLSESGFKQVSFVNSIATTKGGRHVDYVTDMIVKQLAETCKKRNKGGVPIKPFQIKNHLWVFINCLIVNPTFDSQTKEHMTLQAKNFGSKCQISEKFITQITKSNIVDSVLLWAKFKEKTQLEKTSGKKQSKLKGVPKLEDANDAGTKNSIECTLILTEGDSAKSLAVSGLGVIGRDKYGVFPLRGKLLNVREASHKQIMENAEINNIVKIVGLQYKKKYETIEDLKTLRYGKLMIMTDQDQDGSHIKGLIINFIHHNWPSLLRLPFLEEFITPIIKATKGNTVHSFFSIPEFEEWKNETEDWHRYKIKYYKGLGTSTSNEAKEYFSNMSRHRILFKHRSDDDDSHITMAFSKKMIEARKDWLTNWMTEAKRRKELGLGEDYLYAKDTRAVTYKDFINKELVLFSNMDNERSIPSMVDGLKPGSRKVLFTCLKRNDKREIKVAQLAGSVAEHSAYHHGEVSLMSTIVNLAQNFVGSNNINLLQPLGQFGTRLQGGKDAASPRYIFTMLSPLTRMIFHPHDDPLLKYLRDDNLKVEPVWYIPIIPMVLVNGADGIGTGWMTKIPNHNPREIIENLYRMIRGEEPVPMKPWYKNFTGEIEKISDSRFATNGEIGILSDEKLEITELPIGTWTQTYKEGVLEPLLHGGEKEKTPPLINDYKEYNTDTTVKFIVIMAKEKLKKAELEGIHRLFKLQTVINTTSMCAFDKDSVLKRYDTTTQILKEFYDVRLEYYGKRKAYLVGMLEAEALKLTNQARFIVEKCDGDLRIENRKKKEMIAELVRRNYDVDPVRIWKMKTDKESALEEQTTAVDTEDESQPQEDKQTEDSSEDYEYLLGMKLWSLTLEKKNELLKKRDEKVIELQTLQKKSPSDLWIEDLDALLAKLNEVEEKEREAETSTKPIKGLKLGKEKGIAKKKQLQLTTASLPSPHAIRIVPKYDDILKKAERADAAKENKGKRTAAAKKKEDKDDDAMIENSEIITEDKAKGTAKKAPREKKSKKPVSPGKKSVKGRKAASEDLSENDSGDSDLDDDSGGGAVNSLTVTPVRSTSRRTTTANVKYRFDDSDEVENLSSDDEFHDNIGVTADTKAAAVVDGLPPSDEERGGGEGRNVASAKKAAKAKLPNNDVSDFESDDSIKIDISDTDSDSDFDNKKKTKKVPSKKRKSANDSDEDFGTSLKKKSAAKTTISKKKGVVATDDKPKTKKEAPKRGKLAVTKSKVAVPKKKYVDSDDDDDLLKLDSSDDETVKKKTATKRKASSSSESEDFTLYSKKNNADEEDPDKLFDTLLESKPKRAAAPTKKLKDEFSFEPSVHSMDDTSDNDYQPSPLKKKGAKAAAKPAAKKGVRRKKKIVDSDSDDFMD